jgi:hypothetical protein
VLHGRATTSRSRVPAASAGPRATSRNRLATMSVGVVEL